MLLGLPYVVLMNQFLLSRQQMYILISDFTWLQSDEEVYVTVPLKGTQSKNCDILIASRYAKAHLLAFIFLISGRFCIYVTFKYSKRFLITHLLYAFYHARL